MNLKNVIDSDLIIALKSKDSKKANALRNLKSKLMEYEKSKNFNELTKELDYIVVLQKTIKQREDSIEAFTEANRQDLVLIEVEELNYLNQYAPEKLSDKQIEEIIIEEIKNNNFNLKEFGKAMKLLTEKLKGKADGKIISDILKKNI